MKTFEFTSRSPAATQALGRKMGERLAAGTVFALTGELGCGKTLLTRGICEGLNVPLRQVSSPTFVLVNEYRGRLPVYHMDLYRLDDIDQGFEIGIMDYFSRAESGIMLIEWAEKMASILPEAILKVQYEVLGPKKRKITFSWSGSNFDDLFKGLK
jgi:tRNA threonylcarbamoyladenosine biosynthesis protein TsaE